MGISLHWPAVYVLRESHSPLALSSHSLPARHDTRGWRSRVHISFIRLRFPCRSSPCPRISRDRHSLADSVVYPSPRGRCLHFRRTTPFCTSTAPDASASLSSRNNPRVLASFRLPRSRVVRQKTITSTRPTLVPTGGPLHKSRVSSRCTASTEERRPRSASRSTTVRSAKLRRRAKDDRRQSNTTSWSSNA